MSELAAAGLFTVLVLGMLALDLGVFHRRAHAVSLREAALWSAVWIAISLAFDLFIYYWHGPQPALEFLAGYILEKSLSMDNVLIFAVIFSTTAVPLRYQHKVLFWGILGALIMRGGFIAAGAALISRFHWILYVFGVFLMVTGVRLLRRQEQRFHPERNPVLRLARKLFAFTEDFQGSAFFVRRQGRLMATPMLLVLVMIETIDVLFAVDSIPAVFAVTSDPFIVYTSNILAILGLRALYFVLAGAMIRFRYLRVGLSIVLLFVGAKMLLIPVYRIPIVISLAVICGILGVAILASLAKKNPGASKPAGENR
jgi:TerC family integral membrane protein